MVPQPVPRPPKPGVVARLTYTCSGCAQVWHRDLGPWALLFDELTAWFSPPSDCPRCRSTVRRTMVKYDRE